MSQEHHAVNFVLKVVKISANKNRDNMPVATFNQIINKTYPKNEFTLKQRGIKNNSHNNCVFPKNKNLA